MELPFKQHMQTIYLVGRPCLTLNDKIKWPSNIREHSTIEIIWSFLAIFFPLTDQERTDLIVMFVCVEHLHKNNILMCWQWLYWIYKTYILFTRFKAIYLKLQMSSQETHVKRWDSLAEYWRLTELLPNTSARFWDLTIAGLVWQNWNHRG